MLPWLKSLKVTNPVFSARRWATGLAAISTPVVAYEVMSARRGEQVPTLAGRSARLLTFPTLAAGAAAVAATVVNPASAAVFGVVAAMYPESRFERALNRSVRTFTRAGLELRQLQLGGSLLDTDSARTLRQRAVGEMSGALGHSRRWLGREAAYLHR